MDEQTRILVANERTKALSSVVVNLGTALTAASFAKGWADGEIGAVAVVWFVFGVVAISLGVHMLRFLES
ncbi:MAG: hypothetical protein ACXU61_05205 [Croceibacterium sp.]